MKFFRISKWEKYQHYHKPRPPWLKFYTSINDIDTDWRPLKDHQLGQFMRLMAYAALNDNTMPFDNDLIKELLDFDQPVDLKVFAKLKVITVFPSRSSCLSREKSRKKSRQNPILPSSEVRDQRLEGRDQSKNRNSCSTSGQAEPDPPPVKKDGEIKAQELCRLLAQKMVDNDPNARLPKTEKQKATWIMDMERINRIDGRDWLIIRAVIEWSQDDGFWRGNIRSPGKLRKQFPALILAMKRNPARSKAEAREKKNREVMETAIRKVENETSGAGVDSDGRNLRSGNDTTEDGGISGGTRRIPAR